MWSHRLPDQTDGFIIQAAFPDLKHFTALAIATCQFLSAQYMILQHPHSSPFKPQCKVHAHISTSLIAGL